MRGTCGWVFCRRVLGPRQITWPNGQRMTQSSGTDEQGGTDETALLIRCSRNDCGCARIRRGHHHIGFTASHTGPLNVDSTGQERGYQFWRDEVNAKGGIKVGGKSYKIKFVSYDDQSVGGRVQQLYTRLINQDKAQFLFSPYSSGLVAPAAVIPSSMARSWSTAAAPRKSRSCSATSTCSW